ncbi:sulfatase-like hydrolase/transferase [uncultured Selenomonas sp.]|uniref:LTA synthase family protein n=1 Tax=uncultured Selenomonas sp. TaxID=159275 RepID=UPI0028D3F5C0|nr:sulfatase-like hydrolase/transferase [uncultured Selenomonas sp.]
MRIERYHERQAGRLAAFYDAAQRDLKLFVFILLTLCIYRAYFMFFMAGYMMPATPLDDIALALATGFRLSLKTAGIVALIGFVLATLPLLVSPRLSYRLRQLRLAWGTLAAFAFAVLFQARFPFYRQYQTGFHMQVTAGLNDDITAIFLMMVQEYGFIWRFGIALILTALSFYALRYLLCTRGTYPLPVLHARGQHALFSVGLVLVFALLFLFVRFGGSFTYAHGVNWENAGVTGDAFLNECILDDGQALYRVYSMYKRIKGGDIAGVDKTHVRELARAAAGHSALTGDTLTPYLTRTAQGARIPKPRHIFIVLGETYAQWPMLAQYADLHAADGIKSLIQETNAYYSRRFMPNGEFTSIAITGLVTGLSEVNQHVNYVPRSLKEAYPTAMAPQFKRLGYTVDFWYGGMPSWEGMNRFSCAQGFDHFYGYPDFHAEKVNAWGTTDRQLFDALFTHLADEPPTVHLIMTVSNHPPYDIDVAAEGYDLERARTEAAKIPNVDDPDQLALELGHYWYMDKVVTNFVRETMERYPDSLFVITGDHAVRMNPSRTPTMYEFQSVPFVLYGQGVTQEILPSDVVGGHTNIVPTLIELIAPAGFSYVSIAPSLTENNMGAAFNDAYFLTQNIMGEVGGTRTELLPDAVHEDAAEAYQMLRRRLVIQRTLSWQLIEHGDSLEGQ